ncbi:MAG TPA: thiol:disulfide interchange protein DsbA/DsbL [Gammaproteobacteria bacterium]|nr:thiol:disulfide interchange protein DsbA/DsbL [Gammaproteobacteria bacterium]
MLLKHSWTWLVLVLLAGCGGGNSGGPSGAAGTAADEAAAAQTPSPAQSSTEADGTAPPPTTGRFELGANYTRLSPTQPTSSSPDKVEVAEVFWYGCPHCNALEPFMTRWLARKPDYVSFVRIPGVGQPLWKFHARAFYTAEALGKGEEMHAAFFREIHENGNYLETEDKLRDFFAKFGVSATDFKTTFDSFAVQTKLQRAEELNRRYRVTGVPAIVINGKYFTDVGMAGGQEQLIELIDELAAAEEAGK